MLKTWQGAAVLALSRLIDAGKGGGSGGAASAVRAHRDAMDVAWTRATPGRPPMSSLGYSARSHDLGSDPGADGNDPAINNRTWRKLREQVKALRLPCVRCGGWIDYDNAYGKQNPRSFVLGHRVSRREARARGWTAAQMNDPVNLQPECRSCSNRSGAQLGRSLQNGRPPMEPIVPFADYSDRW
jgi:hypothetical protein